MPVGDLFEVITYAKQNQQLALNVSHWRITTVVATTAADNVIANALADQLLVNLKNMMATNAEAIGLTVQYIAPGALRDKVADNGDSRGAGALEGDPLPLQTCGLITLRTGAAGRARRGRKYFPFPAEADSNAVARPSSGYITLLGIQAVTWSSDVTAGTGSTTTVLHCQVYQKGPGIAYPVTDCVIRTRWATQRRRSDINRADTIPPTI